MRSELKENSLRGEGLCLLWSGQIVQHHLLWSALLRPILYGVCAFTQQSPWRTENFVLKQQISCLQAAKPLKEFSLDFSLFCGPVQLCFHHWHPLFGIWVLSCTESNSPPPPNFRVFPLNGICHYTCDMCGWVRSILHSSLSRAGL